MLFAISSWVKIRAQIKKREKTKETTVTAWSWIELCLGGVIWCDILHAHLFFGFSQYTLPVYSACVHFWSRAICVQHRKMWMIEDSSRNHSQSFFQLLIKWLALHSSFQSIKESWSSVCTKIGLCVETNKHAHTYTHIPSHNYLGSFTQPHHFHILCFMFLLPSTDQMMLAPYPTMIVFINKLPYPQYSS